MPEAYEWYGTVTACGSSNSYIEYTPVQTGTAYVTSGGSYTLKYITSPYVTATAGIIQYQTTVCQADYELNPYHHVAHWIQSISYGETEAEKAARQTKEKLAEVAASRADQLLMSLLSPDQQAQYRRDQRFDLVIDSRTYRIHKGRSGNVQLIEQGKPVARYCAHPEIVTPHGDVLIAQLLMLKTDEARFLQIANRTALV